jgi:glycosyltransferase involved in cell wall biosynthesis
MSANVSRGWKIAVVVPCYRVAAQVLGVIERIGPSVAIIYTVDDACPEHTGDRIRRECGDARVRVFHHPVNQGVGGATITGYRAALADGADIVVKLDGDGQMDPAEIDRLVTPILAGQADYTKGNRFHELEFLRTMPRLRLLGNSLLSLVSKLASGYWDVMDPTNGFTAVHREALSRLPLDKIDRGYFFESDMLFRLYTIRAVVRDVPMPARYDGEPSSLRIGRVATVFPWKYARAAIKRLFYSYFLRDFNAGTLQFVLGSLIALAGVALGAGYWLHSAATGVPTTSGQVMLAALPILVGAQLLVAALNYDIGSVPRDPLQRIAHANPPT